jgi:Flp pilus assembly protein TadG
MRASARSRRHPARLARDRRGATAVLIALLLVPLTGMVALAVDASWWQVGATQLQTAADAAALSAARAAQLFRTDAASRTVLSAQTMAAQNKVFSGTATVAASNVVPCRYTPAGGATCGGTVTWTSTGTSEANAVRVTATASAPLTFGGVFRSAGPAMSRRATAWIANVNSGSCIAPFGLPYSVLYDAGARLAGDPASTAATRPDLTARQLAAINSASEENRTVVMYGQSQVSTIPTSATGLTAYDGQWQGFGYNGNNGQNEYQASFWTCGSAVLTVGSTGGTTLSTSGSDRAECWTVRALTGSSSNQCNNAAFLTGSGPNAATCVYRGVSTTGVGGAAVNTYDAGCYPTAAAASAGLSPGVIVRATWADVVGTGANALKFREIGRFRIVCVFREAASAAPGSGTTTEQCQSGTKTYTNLPIGTIVGQVQGITAATLSPGVTLGTTTGDVQRLILVQ